jgi:hypothetical protein
MTFRRISSSSELSEALNLVRSKTLSRFSESHSEWSFRPQFEYCNGRRTIFVVEIERRRFSAATESPFVRLTVLPSNHVTVSWGSGFGKPLDSRRSVSRCSQWRNGDRVDELDLLGDILDCHESPWCVGVATYAEQTQPGGSLALSSSEVENDERLRFLQTPHARAVHAVDCEGLAAVKKERCDHCATERIRLQNRSSQRSSRASRRFDSQRTKRDRAILESNDGFAIATSAFNEFVETIDACVAAVQGACAQLETLNAKLCTLPTEQISDIVCGNDSDGDLSKWRDALAYIDVMLRHVLLGERLGRDDVDTGFLDVLNRIGHRAYRHLCRCLSFLGPPSRTLLMSVRPRMERQFHTNELISLVDAKRRKLASMLSCDLTQLSPQLTDCVVMSYDELSLRPQLPGSRIASGSLFGARVGAATPAPHVTLTPTKDAKIDGLHVTSGMCFSVHVLALNLTVLYATYPTIGAADGGQVVFALQEVEQSLRALGLTVIGHISDAGRVQVRAETKLRAALTKVAVIDTDAIDLEASDSSDDDAPFTDEGDDDGVAQRIDFSLDSPRVPDSARGDDAHPAASDSSDNFGNDETPLSYSWRDEDDFDCLTDPTTSQHAMAALNRGAAPHSFDFVHLVKLLFKHLHRVDGCRLRMAEDSPVLSFGPLRRLVHVIRATSFQLHRPDLTTRTLVRAATPPNTTYDTMKAKPALSVFGTRKFAAESLAVWNAAQAVPYAKSALERESVSYAAMLPLIELSERLSWLAEHVFMSKLAIGPARYWKVLRPRMVAEADRIHDDVCSWPSTVPAQFALHKPPKQTLQLFVKMLRSHVDILDTFFAHAARARSAAITLGRPEGSWRATARPAALATQELEYAFRIVRERSRAPDIEDVDAAFSNANRSTLRAMDSGRSEKRNARRRRRRQKSTEMLSRVEIDN